MLYLDIWFVISTNFANLFLYLPPPPKKKIHRKRLSKIWSSIEHFSYIILHNVSQTHTDGKVEGG